MTRVEEIKHDLRLDFETTAKQRRDVLSRHPDDQRNADAIRKLQDLAATVDEIPDDVAIEYGELCEGDDLCMEEASQMRQRIGFSDDYASALDFVHALIRKQTGSR
jgi:hypothetical protein